MYVKAPIEGVDQSMNATSGCRPSLNRPARTQLNEFPHIAPPIRRSAATLGIACVSTSAMRHDAPARPHQSPPFRST